MNSEVVGLLKRAASTAYERNPEKEKALQESLERSRDPLGPDPSAFTRGAASQRAGALEMSRAQTQVSTFPASCATAGQKRYFEPSPDDVHTTKASRHETQALTAPPDQRQEAPAARSPPPGLESTAMQSTGSMGLPDPKASLNTDGMTFGRGDEPSRYPDDDDYWDNRARHLVGDK